MTTSPFKPPRGITVEVPYRSIVLRADPDFEYKNRHQLFYEFSNGREFREDENQHGAYRSSDATTGPVSVLLTGFSVAGNAGAMAQMQPHLSGVGGVAGATHVTGIGTEDDVPLRGVAANASAGNVLTGAVVGSVFSIGMNLVDITSGAVTTPAELDYAKSKGCTHIRLVIGWEKLQPTLLGALDTTIVADITTVVTHCQSIGIKCWIDLHNYARYQQGATTLVLGDGTLTTAHLNHVWTQLATTYAPYAPTVSYDIMNEPHDMPGDGPTWTVFAQSCVNAIRVVDPNAEIIVEGYHFANTYDWAGFNPDLHTLVDSVTPSNITFSGHMYPDPDDSGGDSGFDWDTCVAIGDLLDPGQPLNTDTSVKRLTPFITWLESYGFRGNIGESGIAATFGVPNNINWMLGGQKMLDYLQLKEVPFCAFSGGGEWQSGPPPSGYAYSLAPGTWISLGTIADAEQWALLTQYTGAAQPTVYFMTGPSSGTVSTPSSNFTVPYRGVLASPVTVTPNDSGAGGTFTPSSVTLAAAGTWNPTATFTYTPPAGTMTTKIAVTNNGGLTDPAGIVFSTEVDLFAGIAIPQSIISDVQMYAAYIGPARNMYRISDGATLDFGFAGQALGVANLGRVLDTAAIAAWAPGGAKTVIRYDQSPHANHMQPVTAQSAGDSGHPSTTADYPVFSIDADGFPTDTFSNSRMDLPSPLHGATGQTIIANYNFTGGTTLLNWDFTSQIEFGPSYNQTSVQDCVFTGSVAGITLTIDSVARGSIAINQFLHGPTIPAFTQILSGSGSTWTITGTGGTNSHVGMTTDGVDHPTNEQGAMSLGTIAGEYHIYSGTWQANTVDGWRTWRDAVQVGKNTTYASELTQDFNRSVAHLGYTIFGGSSLTGKLRDCIVFGTAIPDANKQAIDNFLVNHYSTVAPTTVAWDIVLDFIAGSYTVSGSSVALSSVVSGATVTADGLASNASASLIGAALSMVAGTNYTWLVEFWEYPDPPSNNAGVLHFSKGAKTFDAYVSPSYVAVASPGGGAAGSGTTYGIDNRHLAQMQRFALTRSPSALATAFNGIEYQSVAAALETGWTACSFGNAFSTGGHIRSIKIAATNVSQIQLRNASDVIGSPVAPLAQWLPGVNEQGPNFASGIFWPPNQSIDYYVLRGMKSNRVAFEWARLQPALNGALDTTHLTNFDRIIAEATSLGMTTFLDCHSFGAHETFGSIGNGTVTMANLANMWGQLATRYASNPLVGFDLMNEPGGPLTQTQWYSGVQLCITAIRGAGAAGVILIPSYGQSSNSSAFTTGGNSDSFLAAGFTDTNYALTVHHYLDSTGSGQAEDAARYTGYAAVRAVIRWCRANSVRFYLGELGVAKNPAKPAGITEWIDLLGIMYAARDVCLGYAYFAGGPAWGDNYIFNSEPHFPASIAGLTGWAATPYGERPQMGAMRMFLNPISGVSATGTAGGITVTHSGNAAVTGVSGTGAAGSVMNPATLFPGQVANPVGFAATPSVAPASFAALNGQTWPGSYSALTPWPGGTGFQTISAGTHAQSGSGTSGDPWIFAFYDFNAGSSGTVFNLSNAIFVGCRFQSNDVNNYNTHMNSSVSNCHHIYCSWTPLASAWTSPPQGAWPSAGAGLQIIGSSGAYNNLGTGYCIPVADAYQYGIDVNGAAGPSTQDHCDFWGMGNCSHNLDSASVGAFTITDCWIHDNCNGNVTPPGGSTNYHQDGIFNGGNNTSVSNLTMRHNTIASIGNTNGIALQTAATAYSNITLDSNFLSGYGNLVDIGHNVTGNNGMSVTNNTFGTDLPWVFGPLYTDFHLQFAHGNPNSNVWSGNKLKVLAGTSTIAGQTFSWTTGDDGKFLHPDATLATSDW